MAEQKEKTKRKRIHPKIIAERKELAKNQLHELVPMGKGHLQNFSVNEVVTVLRNKKPGQNVDGGDGRVKSFDSQSGTYIVKYISKGGTARGIPECGLIKKSFAKTKRTRRI